MHSTHQPWRRRPRGPVVVGTWRSEGVRDPLPHRDRRIRARERGDPARSPRARGTWVSPQVEENGEPETKPLALSDDERETIALLAAAYRSALPPEAAGAVQALAIAAKSGTIPSELIDVLERVC